MSTPDATLLAASPRVALLHSRDAPLDLGALTFTAKEVTLIRVWINETEVATGVKPLAGSFGTNQGEERHRLHNVTIHLEAEDAQPGYVGIIAEKGSTLEMLTGLGSKLTAREKTTLQVDENTDQVTNGQSDYRRRAFFATTDIPHVLTSTAGDLRFVGSGQLKILGLPLRVESEERDFVIRTGVHRGSDLPARNNVVEWVVLEASDLELHASAQHPWQFTSTQMTAEWTGETLLQVVSGSIETATGTHDAAGKALRLDGSFESTLIPTRERGTLLLRMDLTGTLVESNLDASTATAPTRASTSWSPLILLGVAIVLAGSAATGIVLFRRRPKAEAVPAASGRDVGTGALPLDAPPEMTAEYYVGLAEQALQFEDHVKALHWITLARQTAPTSAHVATTLAYVLGELGHYDEALETYEQASRLDSGDGEADLNAARLASQAAQPAEVVERFLLRALERSPEFVVDVEDDPELRAVMDRPAVRRGVRMAWDRWGSGERVR